LKLALVLRKNVAKDIVPLFSQEEIFPKADFKFHFYAKKHLGD
jgi:hypothetical protein